MKGGADGFGAGIGRAADKAVGIPGGHHQGGEVKRTAGDGRRFHLGEPLGATALVVERFITGEPGARGGVVGFDQDGLQQVFALQARDRGLHAGIVTFREHDARARRQLAQALGLGSDEGFGGLWNSHANSTIVTRC